MSDENKKRSINEDFALRISLEKIANEEGDWLDAPTDERVVLQAAIFESFFSYITLATEEASMEYELDLSPGKILNAMMKRSELDVLDALLKSYSNRFMNND